MTPERALSLLDSTVAHIQLSRQDHSSLMEAVNVLTKSLQELEELKNR